MSFDETIWAQTLKTVRETQAEIARLKHSIAETKEFIAITRAAMARQRADDRSEAETAAGQSAGR